MADMRERLIELNKIAQNDWLSKTYDHETKKKLEAYVADYLIENGVTIVEHGKWEVFGKRGDLGYVYACSECNAKYDGKSPRCPTCGAKMDKECEQ